MKHILHNHYLTCIDPKYKSKFLIIVHKTDICQICSHSRRTEIRRIKHFTKQKIDEKKIKFNHVWGETQYNNKCNNFLIKFQIVKMTVLISSD